MQNIFKRTVTERSNGGETTIAQQSTEDTQTQTLASIIYFVAGFLEIALLARFVLKLTGANPNTGFVSAIYGFTQILTLPFRGIFPTTVSATTEIRAVFEPATLVALAVYALLAWGMVRLVAILAGHSNEEL